MIKSIKKVDESGRWALDYIQARLYQASELIPLDDQMGMGVSPEQNVAYMAEPQKKQFPSGSHLALHDPNSRKSFRVLGLPGKMATFSTGIPLILISKAVLCWLSEENSKSALSIPKVTKDRSLNM